MKTWSFSSRTRRWPVAVAAIALCSLAGTAALAQTSYPPYDDYGRTGGTVGQVRIVDRDTGNTLPFYRHNGELWVAGRPGARYGISMTGWGGRYGGRVEAVVSVDGVNVITGQTASLQQTGYVLDSGNWHTITGWRKNDSEVAAFTFTALPRSYAARTGRPDNVGVIGVAFYRERPQPVYRPRPPMQPEWRGAPSFEERGDPRAKSTSPAPAAPRSESYEGNIQQDASRLGTGHGPRESSAVDYTTFARRSNQPDQIVTIRYDSYENLVEMGIIPRPRRYRPGVPQPFPHSTPRQYVPDPPNW